MVKERILGVTLYTEYIIFIIVGVIFKYCFKIDLLFKGWWLLIAIIPVVCNIIFRKNKINNIVLLSALIVSLLIILDVLSFNKGFIILLCIAIIYIGINVIKNLLFVPNYDSFKEVYFYNTLFSEDIEKINNVTFKGCRIWNVCGSTTLDLVNAKIESDALIKVYNILGNVNIITGDNIDIIKTHRAILGESKNLKDNKTRKKNKVIIIEGFSLLGSFKTR